MTAILLGTRNTLYGLRMAPLLAVERAGAGRPPRTLLIDESTAMAVNREQHRGRPAGLPHDRAAGLRPLERSPPSVGALAGYGDR